QRDGGPRTRDVFLARDKAQGRPDNCCGTWGPPSGGPSITRSARVKPVPARHIHVAPLPGAARRTVAIADYVALAKPRLNVLVVATSAAGYYLGSSIRPSLASMLPAIVGTALVAGGAAALNQVY